MDLLLSVLGAILAIVWVASAAYLYEVAKDAAANDRRALDAYDWLQIALGPFTAIPLLMGADHD